MPHRSRSYETRVDRPATAAPPAPLVFDRAGVRAVDRAAVEEFGIPSIVLMENAARALCREAIGMLAERGASVAPQALIVCGSGNNGGDGYALARHLHNQGVEALLAPLGDPDAASDAGVNREVCRRMKLREINTARDLSRALAAADLVVDAIFGTGLDRPMSGAAADAINAINAGGKPVLAADLPSGMDCDTGLVLGCCVRATRTVTFVGQKLGFAGLDAQELLGELVVGDIGAPRELLERFGRPAGTVAHPEPPEHEVEMVERVAAHPGT